MNKFKVLKYHDFALMKLVIHPFVIYYVLLNFISFIASSVAYVYQNASQVDIALRASPFIFGACQAFGMFYTYGMNLSEMQAVHSKLNKISGKIVEGMFCI